MQEGIDSSLTARKHFQEKHKSGPLGPLSVKEAKEEGKSLREGDAK